MRSRSGAALAALLLSGLGLTACGTTGQPVSGPALTPTASAAAPAIGAATSVTPAPTRTPTTTPAVPATSAAAALPKAGNPAGHAAVPAAAQPVDTSHPDRVIGSGSPAGCTSQAVVAAVAAGGVITFDCGPAPVTITLAATAKVRNASARVVLDGGGRVTLSGGGRRRILYQDTCDQAQGWTTAHCQDQDQPHLTVQNLTLADGNSTGEQAEGGGGGALFVRGGRLTVINSRFLGNRCDATGPDLGGAAIRALSQYHDQPVYVVDSTFDGGACANGGGLSSIGVSWVVRNSEFSGNSATGHGANPAAGGTPGGGSGGAIYTDGNTYTVDLAGCLIEHNHANAGGGAVFFVSNDRTGSMSIAASTLRANPSAGFETAGFPGIFFLGAHPPAVTTSTLTR